MPMLGDILASARDAAGPFEAWLRGANPEAARQVAEAAAGEGMSPTSFVRAAVADFARFADADDWATLTSAIRDDADPGTVCLLGMVQWRLTVPACEHHSAGRSEAV